MNFSIHVDIYRLFMLDQFIRERERESIHINFTNFLYFDNLFPTPPPPSEVLL